MPPNRIFSFVFCFVLAVGQFAQAQDGGNLPSLKPLAGNLRPLVLKHYPNAKFTFEKNKIHFESNTFKYQVHGRQKIGGWREKMFETIGPQSRSGKVKGGVISDIEIHAGRYAGAAAVPQVIHDPYFDRLLMAPESGNHYLNVRMSYANDISPEFLAGFKNAVNGFGKKGQLNAQAANNSGAKDKLPNILILYADDLGFGDLTCYNAKSKIPTPNLDQLAKQSLRFTDGHSSSGICTPSRYALLTGRHHWRDFHGIVNAFGGSVFKPERTTMPEMLKTKGYKTAAIGKWHLGWDWDALKKPDAKPAAETTGKRKRKTWGPEAFDWSKSIPDGPLAHGFDHYFGDTVINFPPYCWIEDDKVVQAPDVIMDSSKFKPIKEGNWEFRPGPMIKGWNPYDNIPTTTKRGVEYIKAQAKSDEPFFLYFAFPSPHAPIIPNDAFDGKSGAGPYGDLVNETDDACGQLLRALQESGQAENTIVIFTADNGPEKYAYARDEKFQHWSAHPLRGLKRDIYEGGHRVPFMVKWPGVTNPGKVSDALVSQIDLMATIASAIEFELPDDCAEDSHDLMPILKGESDSVRQSHVHNTRANQYAIRSGDWVLVATKDGYMSGRNKDWEKRHGYPADNNTPAELFNLKDDIHQRYNLADQNLEKAAELQTLLKKIREQGYSSPRLERELQVQ